MVFQVFQAIAMSLAGRVGTGNIVGVSTAIFIGGPGAVFWMWITAFLGASSAFIESYNLVKYSRELKIMNIVVDQRIILNMVLVVNLVKFTELSLLLLRLSQ